MITDFLTFYTCLLLFLAFSSHLTFTCYNISRIIFGSDFLLELIKGLIIFLGNFIIYKSSLDSLGSIFLATFLSSIFEYALLISLENFSKGKKLFPIMFILFFAIFKVGLSLYYNNFGDFYIFSRLKQAEHLKGIGDFFIVELLKPDFIFIYLLTGFLIFLYLRGDEYFSNKTPKIFSKAYFIYASLGLFVLMAVTNVFAGVNEMYTMSLKSFKKDQSLVHALYQDQANDLSKLLFRNYAHKNSYTGLGAGKNILLIQVESLQNIFLKKTYKGKEITPFLNSLVDQPGTIYFTNYHELLGFGNSSDAEYVSLHSAYPNTIDASYKTYKDTYTYGLPKIAKNKGYQTLSFHGNSGTYYNRVTFHKNVGFDKSYFEEDFVKDEEILMGLSDRSFFKQSLPLIKEASAKGPYFAFMISLSSHVPFNMPENLRIFSSQAWPDKDSILYKYMDSIHYFDQQLEIFLKEMEAQGLLDNTIIALYGDHSAMEVSNKEANEAMTKYLDRFYSYQDMQNIPLIIKVPGLDKNINIDQLGSQVDLLPSLLNLMDWNDEVVPMFGVDLFDQKLALDNRVFPQTHMLKGSYYKDDLIFERSRTPGDEGGYVYKDGEKIYQDHLDENSLAGMRLIDYSNYLYDKDLLKDQVEKFKEDLNK